MSRSLELLLALALAVDPSTPVEDLVFPVEDIVAEVESMDGAQSESTRDDEVTVALAGDVLFALDRWVLTAKARQRLTRVAEQVGRRNAGGTIRIEGHTDDQGSDAYNVALSRKRAEAVRRFLASRLEGAFEVQGYGEARPKWPNVVGGRAVPSNQAKNRRVEIVFTAKP
ncbi:OmpA family protein [Nonomuraea sp. NPDC050663]|uniref:OmpA family protein n=1 Tax=Nonomuraea sp. NPDC050663 TaxID=3364370 RepID=UPI0037A597C9